LSRVIFYKIEILGLDGSDRGNETPSFVDHILPRIEKSRIFVVKKLYKMFKVVVGQSQKATTVLKLYTNVHSTSSDHLAKFQNDRQHSF